MKRRPRKVIVTVLVFLLLGAIVNVAAAWGLEVRSPPSFLKMLGTHETESFAFICRSADGHSTWILKRTGQLSIRRWATGMAGKYATPSARFSVYRIIDEDKQSAMIPSWSTFASEGALPVDRSPFSRRVHTERSCGWPFLTLRYTCATRSHFGNSFPPNDYCDGLIVPIRWRTQDRFALPIRPIWPGFAINTLFYAAILWLLFAVPGPLRRWRRIKRGLCPACAYPVGTSDLCTECGEPVNAE